MMINLQHNDIESFLKCPRLYKSFSPDIISQTVDKIQKCITRIFLKELELGTVPHLGSLKTYWSKHLDSFKKEGFTIKKLNDISMGIGNFFYEYINNIKKKYSTVAVWLPIQFSISNAVYNSVIPIVLADKKGRLYPVFFSDKKRLQGRDYLIMYTSAALQNRIRMEVPGYFVIRITSSLMNFPVEQHNFRKGSIKKYLSELSDVLYLMASGYSVPNLNHCTMCKYISKCRV